MSPSVFLVLSLTLMITEPTDGKTYSGCRPFNYFAFYLECNQNQLTWIEDALFGAIANGSALQDFCSNAVPNRTAECKPQPNQVNRNLRLACNTVIGICKPEGPDQMMTSSTFSNCSSAYTFSYAYAVYDCLPSATSGYVYLSSETSSSSSSYQMVYLMSTNYDSKGYTISPINQCSLTVPPGTSLRFRVLDLLGQTTTGGSGVACPYTLYINSGNGYSKEWCAQLEWNYFADYLLDIPSTLLDIPSTGFNLLTANVAFNRSPDSASAQGRVWILVEASRTDGTSVYIDVFCGLTTSSTTRTTTTTTTTTTPTTTTTAPTTTTTYLSSTTKPNNYSTDLSCTAKPFYGPIAGGTMVALTFENWSNVIANISAVYFGGVVKITFLQSGRLDNSAVMTTPVATAALIGQPLPIIIEFTPGPHNRSTNASFTYQGNPEITDISPSTFVFTGGTILTATGIRLSSVANPFIQLTLVVKRGIGKNSTTEKSIEPCEVKAEDSDRMTCRMPSVNIPDDFLQALNSQYSNRSKRGTDLMLHLRAENPFLLSREKRFADALSLTGPNGVDQLVITLGFILDGYKRYENVNDALPDTRILIVSPPEINFITDISILQFDPDKDDSISIKGMHMTRGCRMADYVVEVGADICENIALTDSQLRCRPPKQQPQSTRNTSIYCDELLGIYIHLGYKTYQYACMKYSTRRPLALIIGLAVGLSSFVIILLLIIAIVFCCCKRSRNRRNKSTNKTLDRSTAAGSEAHERPSVQLYDNAGYLRPTDQSLCANDEYEPPSIQLYDTVLELDGRDHDA